MTAIGSHIQAEEELAIRNLGESGPDQESAIAWLEVIAQQRQAHGRSTLTALADFVGSIAGLPGRRAVLYLTGDLRLPAGDSMFRYLAERANAEQVTIYGLGSPDSGRRGVLRDPTGRNGYLDMRGMTANPDELAARLEAVAGPTGGLSGIDLDHPGALLDRIRDDLASYYSLGFAPGRLDGRPHALAVRVRGRRGIEVRAPATYTARTRQERFAGHVD